MNNDLISREALKNTIIEVCGKCSNIITKYENGVPNGNCAIQHILNMIDNAPTVTERPQIIGCFNCKHEKKMSIEEPCRYCNVKYSKWEEKGGAE